MARRGQSVRFHCSTNETELLVSWHFRSAATARDVRIVTGGSIVFDLKDRFAVTNFGAHSVLELTNASAADAGAYQCIDKLGMGETATAELIILGE